MWPIDASMKINVETESSFSLTPALATLKPQAGMAVSVPAATPVQVGSAYLLLTETFVPSINLNCQVKQGKLFDHEYVGPLKLQKSFSHGNSSTVYFRVIMTVFPQFSPLGTLCSCLTVGLLEKNTVMFSVFEIHSKMIGITSIHIL